MQQRAFFMCCGVRHPAYLAHSSPSSQRSEHSGFLDVDDHTGPLREGVRFRVMDCRLICLPQAEFLVLLNERFSEHYSLKRE